MLEAKFKSGQNLLLEDGTTIQLLERWDSQVKKKNYISNEVTWKAFRISNPNHIFVVKEVEIPNQTT